MRLVTWNVGHQTKRRTLPKAVAAGLVELRPDVIVLTEYVYDDGHSGFLAALSEAKLKHWRVSAYVPGQNQVLVISKHALSEGAVRCNARLSNATAPNWLHVRTDGVDVVGFRRPMFKGVPQGVARYWDWFNGAIKPLAPGSAVILGDFNADAGSAVLRGPVREGWRLVTPGSGWSFKGKTGRESAIDHAFVSPNAGIGDARYVVDSPFCSFAGADDSYSDHAVFCCEVSFGSAVHAAS